MYLVLEIETVDYIFVYHSSSQLYILTHLDMIKSARDYLNMV